MSKKISDYFKIQPKVEEILTNNFKFEKEENFEIKLEPNIRDCKVVLKDIRKQSTTKSDLKLFEEVTIDDLQSTEPKGKVTNCSICNIKISTRFLKLHLRTKHPNGQSKRFECDFDGKIFKTKGELYIHMGAHLPLVECIICNKMFKHNSLNGHQSMHANDQDFQCKICSKSFKSAHYLKRHEKIHNKRIQCEICNRMFPSVGILNQHKKECHENERSFECEICSKKFNQMGHLKTHQKTHDRNRPKPLKCSRCDYATDNPYSLKKHQKSHDRQDKKFAAMKNPLKCEKCPTFHRNQNFLKSHMQFVHPDVLFQCDLCAKFIKIRISLISHMKLHISKISKN
jgi:KRAB domain-containing zinc finger protein